MIDLDEALLYLLAGGMRPPRQGRPDRMEASEIGRLACKLPDAEGVTDSGLSAGLSTLAEQGWVRREGTAWALTEEGVGPAEKAKRERTQRYFGDWMVRSSRSAAYTEFCDTVHGTGLIHFDMIDGPQWEWLIEALAVGPGDRVLDVGCGCGHLTCAIAGRTGASVHGIDFAEQAIALATSFRTDATFEVANFDDIELEPKSYDAIVAVDTLYFTADLPGLIARLATGLRSGGRLVLPFSTSYLPGEPEEWVTVDRSRLAQALDGAGLPWEAQEVHDEVRAYWERSLKTAEAMERAFADEGSESLQKSRVAESSRVLAAIDEGRASRFLYRAVRPRLPAATSFVPRT